MTPFPTRAARGWITGRSRNEGARLFALALGACDVALALGTLAALREGRPVRPWAQAVVLADGVDFGATFAAREALPAGSLGFGGVLMSGASTVLGLWLVEHARLTGRSSTAGRIRGLRRDRPPGYPPLDATPRTDLQFLLDGVGPRLLSLSRWPA